MTYRANSSDINFPDDMKATNKENIMLANNEMDEAIMQDKKKSLLRDHPAVESNQNVYDSLSE